MVRYLPIGNGRILINFDADMNLMDFYFSRNQGENHAGRPFKFGVAVNNRFTWSNSNIIRDIDYLDHTMVGTWKFSHNGVDFETFNFVDIYENLYARRIKAYNTTKDPVDIKLYFNQNFNIYGNDIGDTASYMPKMNGVLHYKGRRYFLASTLDSRGNRMDQYAMGIKDFMGLEGSWKDAEDLELSGNSVAMGSVDSVIRHRVDLEPAMGLEVIYFISANMSLDETVTNSALMTFDNLKRFETRTSNYWRLWAGKQPINLEPKLSSMFRKSLFILRSHMSDKGGIVASSDSETIKANKDGYYYVWPRDAAIAAYSLIRSNHSGPARKFFDYAKNLLSEEGYFFHKYSPDGEIASSWLPQIYKGESILPIQQDETALMIWAMWKHYEKINDIEYMAEFYETVVKKCTEFIMSFRDENGLPKESFDLWEERYGVHTFTIATSYAALISASKFARKFGDIDLSSIYEEAARKMKSSFEEKFYSQEKGFYARAIINGKPDFTVDSAIMSLYLFGMESVHDERMISSMKVLLDRLWVKTVGGIARYENDIYQRVRDDSTIPGNPWIITTLWAAEYFLISGDVLKARTYIDWVVEHSQHSGILPEQVNPYNGEPLSVSPLVWSHAQFIITMLDYEKATMSLHEKMLNESFGIPN